MNVFKYGNQVVMSRIKNWHTCLKSMVNFKRSYKTMLVVFKLSKSAMKLGLKVVVIQVKSKEFKSCLYIWKVKFKSRLLRFKSTLTMD